MRVAAIYDIHGNLPALEAVVREVRAAKVDLVVVGGDVVPGPMPSETIAFLRALDLPLQFIRGNGDREVLGAIKGEVSENIPEAFRESIRWNARQLSEDDAGFIAGWPESLRLDLDAVGKALFCHATPSSDMEIFTRLTSEGRLAPLFTGLGVDLFVCGHTHMQFERDVAGVRVVNAGSVGMPFGSPGAYWLLLGPGIEFRRTRYDLKQAAARVRRTNYPQAEEFAGRNILEPPSEAEMLEIFAKLDRTARLA